MPATNDLRADVRARAAECLTLMECVQCVLEMARRKLGDRNAEVSLAAIGRFVDDLGEELKNLDVLITDLLDKDILNDPGVAATALAFYADIQNHSRRPGQRVSAVAEDKGHIARVALEEISGNPGASDD